MQINIENIENGCMVEFKESSLSRTQTFYDSTWNQAIDRAIELLNDQKVEEEE